MKRMAEITAFLGLSAAVHAGVVAGLGDDIGGPQGQGIGGADRVTLQAAPESLAALADRWETPPNPVSMPPAPTSPEPAEAAPVGPIAATDHTPLRRTVPSLTQPDAPAETRPDTSTPPPPGNTARATASSPRPPQRPEDLPREAEAPRPSAPSAPQPARAATGAGGGAAQGAAAAPPQTAPALSAAQRQGLMSQWGAQIMARVERARPRVGASGQVMLALQVARSGDLAGVSVARSSGVPALDEAALSAVRRAGRFPAAPDGLTDASYGFSLPIRFR